MRRSMSHAFSEKALLGQEDIIEHYVSKLMMELDVFAKKGQAVDIAQWLNFCTFDLSTFIHAADSQACARCKAQPCVRF